MSNKNEPPSQVINGSVAPTVETAGQISGPNMPDNAAAPYPVIEGPQTTRPNPAPTRARHTFFHPSVFTIHYAGGDLLMHSAYLINEITRNRITVDNLIYERFLNIIEERTGGTMQTHRLIALVPDAGANLRPMKRISSGREWRAALQQCHDAGWDQCEFYLLKRGNIGVRRGVQGGGGAGRGVDEVVQGAVWLGVFACVALLVGLLIWYMLELEEAPPTCWKYLFDEYWWTGNYVT